MTKKARRSKKGRWSHDVTVRPAATFAPAGVYTKSAREIYLTMRRPDVSPNGLGSAIQMNVFYINRAGKLLNPKVKRRIERANEYLRLELAYFKMRKKFKLKDEPKSIKFLPPVSRRVGGQYVK